MPDIMQTYANAVQKLYEWSSITISNPHQPFAAPDVLQQKWGNTLFLGSLEEIHPDPIEGVYAPILPGSPLRLSERLREKLVYSAGVNMENRKNATNTKFRSSEHERDERSWYSTSWYSTKERPRSIEGGGRERQQHDPQNAIAPVQYFLGPEEKEIHRRLMEREENKSQQRLMEHLRKRSKVFATTVNHINNSTASTEFKRIEDFSSGEKEFYVAGSVNGTAVEALPDTGAEACFISPHLASRLGLHPTPGPQKRIILANKKTVKSPGMVTVPWKFSKERTTHRINCWILPGCVSDLVLGNDFLRATNALRKVCHRIKSKFLGVPKQLSLSYLGNEKQRIRGYLNGHLIAALPDTGSDAMLINGAYARKIGLDVDSDIRNRGTIRLADGSTAVIGGVVRDVEWRVGSTTVQCNFYVLENMCVDIILSNNYLFEMNIFTEQEEHFFDTNSEDGPVDDVGDDCGEGYDEGYEDYIIYFCILSIDTKTHDGILTLQELKERGKLEELYRRDKARDEIMALPEDQREAAAKVESVRQQLWETQKSEREAKWIIELRIATKNVQNGVSRGSRWKKGISISFLVKRSRR